MYEPRGGIVDDLDAVLLGIFGGEGRPISILVLLVTHHCWLVAVVVAQITTHSGCVTLGTRDDSAKRNRQGNVTSSFKL
jgi:hypothetical protein